MAIPPSRFLGPPSSPLGANWAWELAKKIGEVANEMFSRILCTEPKVSWISLYPASEKGQETQSHPTICLGLVGAIQQKRPMALYSAELVLSPERAYATYLAGCSRYMRLASMRME